MCRIVIGAYYLRYKTPLRLKARIFDFHTPHGAVCIGNLVTIMHEDQIAILFNYDFLWNELAVSHAYAALTRAGYKATICPSDTSKSIGRYIFPAIGSPQ